MIRIDAYRAYCRPFKAERDGFSEKASARLLTLRVQRHSSARKECPLWSSCSELTVSLTQASPMSFCGALDITRRRYGVYHLHGLCHGYNRR